MGPERKFRDQVGELLKQLPNSFFESIQQKSIQGTPDKLGCLNGTFVALEFKASIKLLPTPLQALKLQRINQAGGYGLVMAPENLKTTMELLWKLARGSNAQSNLATDPGECVHAGDDQIKFGSRPR